MTSSTTLYVLALNAKGLRHAHLAEGQGLGNGRTEKHLLVTPMRNLKCKSFVRVEQGTVSDPVYVPVEQAKTIRCLS